MKKGYSDFLPLIAIFSAAIISFYLIFESNFLLTAPTIAGYILAISMIPLYFISKTAYRYGIAGLLILGSLNLISFTVETHWIELTFNYSKSLKLQIFSASLLLLYIIMNMKSIQNSLTMGFKSLFLPGGRRDVERTKMAYVRFFKSQFELKSINELMQITQDDFRTDEAILAAKELLDERTTPFSNENDSLNLQETFELEAQDMVV